VALGYTLVFGVLDIINMAHGEIFMFGAFVGMLIVSKAGAPLPWRFSVPSLSPRRWGSCWSGSHYGRCGPARCLAPGLPHQHDRRLHPSRERGAQDLRLGNHLFETPSLRSVSRSAM